MPGALTEDQRARFAEDGFVKINEFADPSTGAAMLDRVVEIVHRFDRGDGVDDAVVMMETQADSQFIFKNAGAWGQPWHQDSYYFPFAPARPVVGVWLAVTEATVANGCLHVVPGSHLEPVHEHVPDARPGAQFGYVEIVDHDMAARVPVLMDPGDLLLFDSHLMHRSTDNASAGLRAAMVYHYAASGTVDRTEALRGFTLNDWIDLDPPSAF